jgi:phage shock protein A
MVRGLQDQVNEQQTLLEEAAKHTAALKARLVAKDARIAELEALLQQAKQR